MRYWWVNQSQTFRHEVEGGYLWSPKRNANAARNPFYESMREVAPGDLIFSFMDAKVLVIGIAQSYCWESPKPIEFGNAPPLEPFRRKAKSLHHLRESARQTAPANSQGNTSQVSQNLDRLSRV